MIRTVRPLAEALRAHHLDVWFDEFALTIGDSLREAIDRGLATSRFGIVVLSPHFFHKRWTQRKLSGLVAREIAEDRRLVLPIWHRTDRDEILRHSPPLADVFGVSSARGMGEVVVELLKRVRPEESPLIVARDFLISMGIDPPIVTDEWWLDVVELKEAQLRFPEVRMRRWIFPLPFPGADTGTKRGMNIGWTALQLDWAYDGEERNICQITHPERVHEFLRKWPGLVDCARANPGVLAMYTPQLTIPGYDDGLADAFDSLLDPSRTDAYQMPQRLQGALLEGLRKRDSWYRDVLSVHNAFAEALFRHTRSGFSFTRKIRSALVELITSALRTLCAQEDPIIVAERFIARRFVDGYYDWQDEIRAARRERRGINRSQPN